MDTPISTLSAVKVFDPARSRYVSSVMAVGLDRLNDIGNRKCLDWRNDFTPAFRYHLGMMPRHDWFLKEWLSTLGVKQAKIIKDLDQNKGKVSLLVSCKQQYTRDDVNLLADYLNIKPYELLMHPSDAMAMRSFKTDAIKIAHSAEIGGENDSHALGADRHAAKKVSSS